MIGCENKTGFTGKERCDKTKQVVRVLLLVQPGTSFPVEKEEFETALHEYINAGRVMPVGGVSDSAWEGGDPITAQVGSYGANKAAGHNPTSVVFAVDGGDCIFKSLKALEGDWDVLTIDEHMIVRGYKKQLGDIEKLYGYAAVVSVSQTMPNGGSLYSIAVRVGFGVDYNTQIGNEESIKIDTFPEGIVGVTLKSVGAGKVKVVSQCAGTDYTELFDGNIEPTMFVDNTGKAVTTATYNGDDNTITLSPTTAPVRVADAKVLSDGNVFTIGGINKYVSIK